MPIYYGCPNTEDIYPPDSFIQLDFSGSIEETVEQVVNIFKNDNYENRLPHLLEAKSLYYTKYNIFNFLEQLINQGKI